MSIPILKSPSGFAATGTPYYNLPVPVGNGPTPTSANGHLKLVVTQSPNLKTPVALKSSLDALTSTVSGKASQANLDSPDLHRLRWVEGVRWIR